MIFRGNNKFTDQFIKELLCIPEAAEIDHIEYDQNHRTFNVHYSSSYKIHDAVFPTKKLAEGLDAPSLTFTKDDVPSFIHKYNRREARRLEKQQQLDAFERGE